MMAENLQNNKMLEPDEVETRRKRLHFRSWHRGTREMDMLLGRFADTHLAELDETGLGEYERLLNNSDPDLYNWISGNEPMPPAEDSGVMRLFLKFKIA